jgi:esterase/lipase/1-acyl-sn-glycerol-3-phosphate acyltransferase
MPLSRIITKATSKLLHRLFNVSGAKLRVHNTENLPGKSVLYVINHFTRIETIFLPYIIHKHTGKYVLSLAHHSFFGGTFGSIMEKLGAVSTKDPERNKILTSALLKEDLSVLIFPEGQMLKDKKLIEKGKYMVYNTGIRRPPHTGAARIALATQFYREKMAMFKEDNNMEAIKEYLNFFGFKQNELDAILKSDTYIVPVNVTYFPIRAKNNAIQKLAGKFLKKIPVRYEEELQVEGTMLLDGVDIDINFGEPIRIKDYLVRSHKIDEKINDSRLFLKKEVVREEIPFKKVSAELMYDYMDSIYNRTTINHDHIFSYILTASPKKVIPENTFKNKAFLAIEKIGKLTSVNLHNSMKKNQFHLLTDDEYKIYDSFIDAATSDNLISVRNRKIHKNQKKFRRLYEFHTVRQDNIVEVIKNEIEPLDDVLKILRKTMVSFPSFDRRKIWKRFLKLDIDMFNQDYEKYSIPEESKPKNIGAPFFLKRFSRKKGVLLVHGYLAAPEEIRVIADNLHREGYNVYGARLRGHGTSPEDLAKRTWRDWYRSVNRAYIVMDNCVDDFAIAGFSTGAGLALLQATHEEKRFRGVISINAPLHLQNITSKFTSAVVAWNKLLKKIKIEAGKFEYVSNRPENPHINYFRNPISGVNELGKLMSVVEENLERVKIPALIIQGSNDPVVNPVSGLEIFEKLGTTDKEMHRIYSNRHGIVRGDESERVTERMLDFLDKIFSKS